jgi:hypothetical protein
MLSKYAQTPDLTQAITQKKRSWLKGNGCTTTHPEWLPWFKQSANRSTRYWSLPGAVILKFDITMPTARYWTECQVWSKQIA